MHRVPTAGRSLCTRPLGEHFKSMGAQVYTPWLILGSGADFHIPERTSLNQVAASLESLL